MVDALQMAIWRRRSLQGRTIVHSDHGSNYSSSAFDRRPRTIGDCFDISVAESCFTTLQLDMLDEHHRESRRQLSQAIFEWIEPWYNPRRRSCCKMLSPEGYEVTHDGMINQ
jgi:putative transposase